MRKLARILPRPAKDLLRLVVSALVDPPHLFKLSGDGGAPLHVQIARTWRYRLAALGLPLTANERAFRSLKDVHKGERCFVVGNGPSLNDCDLTKIKDDVTFCVNSIFLNFEKMGFHPTYYVVEDVFVAEDRANEINDYRGPNKKFFGNYLRYCLEDDDDVIWTNIMVKYNRYPGFPHFSEDALRKMWVGGTVTYISLQLAYYMGFSEVYMVGFDHSYHIPKEAEMEGVDIVSTSDDPNHFDKGYFGRGYRWHDPQVDRMELAYERAKEHYEADGREIYNATVGGHLETFKRVDYDSLF